MKKNKQRVPRPLGITLLSKALNEEPNPNKKQEIQEELYNLIALQYVMGGYQLNKQSMNYMQLSQYMQLDIDKTMSLVIRATKKQGTLFDQEDILITARENTKRAFFWGTEIWAQMQAQLAILQASQGSTYRPFISSEVNKALTNLMNAGKLQQDYAFRYLDAVMKNVPNPDQPNPLIGTLNPNTKSQSYIGTEEALKLIQEANPREAWTEQSVKELMGPSNLNPLPEVKAAVQDLTSIGIRHNGTQAPETIPSSGKDGPDTPDPDPKSHHRNRRQQELNILEDEDLFED